MREKDEWREYCWNELSQTTLTDVRRVWTVGTDVDSVDDVHSLSKVCRLLRKTMSASEIHHTLSF
ncbi:hypothetical protein T4D_7122 [Trichinella pseudospiralis]|uniref:Uncharacterized protein n=1 Tax=Trichinella pseudospiralis TaxID=6337 RepID=A0A0V1FM17_TRIPS|nr:hypothetical protein T4D_7122 [Trichinella pseudospiralis]